jgi:hypothetical protein
VNDDLLSQPPQVLAFSEAIAPMLPAYRYGLLSFVAIVHKGDTVIFRARLRLSVESPTLETSARIFGQISGILREFSSFLCTTAARSREIGNQWFRPL